MISLIREIIANVRLHRRLAVEIESRRGEIFERNGLRVELAALTSAIVEIARLKDAEALLSDPPAHLVGAVRRLAIMAIYLPRPVPGLIELACDVCGRRYPGSELHMHQEVHFSITRYEGRCPAGHVLPALPNQMVIA
jgi:hypothetical protein